MIVRLSGGLGNQMFQYAFGRALSQKKGESLYLDDFSFNRDELRDYALENYSLKAQKLSFSRQVYYNIMFYYNRKFPFIPRGEEKYGMYYEKEVFCLDDGINVDAKYYDGCWQNEAYFSLCLTELREELTYRGKLSKEKEELVKKMNRAISVAVHVRHGDYLNDNNKLIYEIPMVSYYLNAMQLIKSIYPKSVFFFFSDDLEWCKSHFGNREDSVFPCFDVPCTAQEDIYLMQQCDHYIIANSSFSWWAACLGKKDKTICIAPKTWLKNRKINEDVKKALLKEFILL